MPNIIFSEKGLIQYSEALEFQKNLFYFKIKEKKAGITPQNHIFWCEHPHVYTLGKNGDPNNLLINEDFLNKINAGYHQSDRGGDITYHGPGQIVGYPIIDTDQFGMGVSAYIYALEHAVMELLTDYNISGQLKKGAAGVWLEPGSQRERKICAVGVKMSHGITMHGFALNVNTDLSYFNHINPCGFENKGVSSLQKELGKEISTHTLKLKLQKILKNILLKGKIKKSFV
ncbi:MAG: lipoyl(octanoyl) transferase LipB [Bacteroidota bacterium]|nr:lipoyl(octanoyl) transferase LipB [Bacteroidota bacterium]